jgi:hypothetical protein
MDCLAIFLLMYAHPFPSVFLVVKLKCCAVGGQDEFVRRVFGAAAELSQLCSFEKGDVLKFELYRLFCVAPFAFDRILSDSKEVIESD